MSGDKRNIHMKSRKEAPPSLGFREGVRPGIPSKFKPSAASWGLCLAAAFQLILPLNPIGHAQSPDGFAVPGFQGAGPTPMVVAQPPAVAKGAPVMKRSLQTRNLVVQVSPSTVEVALPAGCTSCVVEAKLRGRSGWLRWRSFATKPGQSKVSFVPPRVFSSAGSLVEQWRATGTIDSSKVDMVGAKRKYPEAFYRGAKTFQPTPAAGYESGISSTGNSLQPRIMAMDSNAAALTGSSVMGTTASNSAKTVSTTESQSNQKAEEADIWRTDGNLVFFFNQLRGLQVIDVSDPSKPVMQARLRMPAVGQDLYLLPEQTAGERLVVLLTRSYDDALGSQFELVVVRVTGAKAEVVSRRTVVGSLQDSRMVGNRLYVLSAQFSGDYWTSAYKLVGRAVPIVAEDGNAVPTEAPEAEPESNTTLTELVIGAGGSLNLAASVKVPVMADSSFLSAGGDWLAVSSNPRGDWNRSQVTLYSLSQTGVSLLTPRPIQTRGRVNDKFKIGYRSGTLMAVTQEGWGTQAMVRLECFDSGGAAVSSMDVIRGENVYATRYNPERLYIVTAVQHDPLWVVNIADPRNPVMEGHVEVPGFSTYIDLLGDDGRFLFTIGLEFGKVVASLFDVSDPLNPILTPNGRVQVSSEDSGYSEAVWDEKALKVLPEEGLALIPFSGGWWNRNTAFVRLVDIDLTDGGGLKLRGQLEHNFVPRRATLTNGVLTSISQKELITADIADRDKPSVLAEVALAWPVNQVLATGDYLLQIADGSSAFWSNEPASIAVSRVDSEDSIQQIVELGAGSVCEASVRGSKLYVLRRTGSNFGVFFPMVRMVASVDGGDSAGTAPEEPGLALDVYDLSALPKLTLMGTVKAPVSAEALGDSIGSMLWINETTAAVVTQSRSWRWDFWFGPMYDAPVTAKGVAAVRITPPYLRRLYQPGPAMVRAFDVSKPGMPAALKPVELKAVTDTMVSVIAAGDGLLVYAYGENPSPVGIVWSAPAGKEPVSANHRLGVVDYFNPASPVVRSPVQMPGRVFAITDISRAGFLAYTESITGASAASKPAREVQMSVVDEVEAVLVAKTPVAADAVLAAEGRSLYVAANNQVQRLTVNDQAAFASIGAAKVDWTPAELQIRGLTLLGTSGAKLMRVNWAGLTPSVESWKMRQWFGLSKMTIGSDRTIYAPMGDFGVERFGGN